MLLFNIILIIHFIAFLWYTSLLVLLYPQQERKNPKIALALGIVILVTGLSLAALKFPAVNNYKLIPKSAIFITISMINAAYSKKPLPKAAYFTVLSLMILASLIAVVKV